MPALSERPRNASYADAETGIRPPAEKLTREESMQRDLRFATGMYHRVMRLASTDTDKGTHGALATRYGILRRVANEPLIFDGMLAEFGTVALWDSAYLTKKQKERIAEWKSRDI